MIRPSLFLVLILATLGSGCHSRPPKVDCEAHLKAINAPASVAQKTESRP
jgi:hypothetical protein